jgi:hypothetical protein
MVVVVVVVVELSNPLISGDAVLLAGSDFESKVGESVSEDEAFAAEIESRREREGVIMDGEDGE